MIRVKAMGIVTEVWPQNTALPLLVVDIQLVDVTQTTTKTIWEKAKKNNNQANIDSIGLKTLRTVELLPWLTACEKDYKCVLLFVIIQACENMVLND